MIMSGKIDISKLKVLPEQHELDTARYFAERGHDIEFIPPNNSPNMHTPDIKMDGVEWEIKSPIGKSKRTIEQSFRKAVLQSRYIIFDLRRVNISEVQAVRELEHRFNTKRYLRRLLVIKKSGELLDYSR